MSPLALSPLTERLRIALREPKIALALLLVVTAFAYRGNLTLGFTDTDAIADVAYADVNSLADLGNQLVVPLTGGVASTNANFYRPVVMLQFTALRAVFGWNPVGYQLWGIALHLGAVSLLFLLARSWGMRLNAAIASAAIFALHPLGVEVVPAVARNIDSLLTVLVLGMLLAFKNGRGRWAIVLGLLAVCTKETAVAALPAGVLAAWWTGPKAQRTRVTLETIGAWIVGVAAYLVARSHVLSGLGGYHDAHDTITLKGLTHMLKAAPWEMLFPGWTEPLLQSVPAAARLPGGILMAACGLAVMVWAVWKRDRSRTMGWALLVLPIFLYGLTGTFSRRLLYLPTAGIALLLGQGLFNPCWKRSFQVLSVLLTLSLLPASPLVHQYQGWAANDRSTKALTTDLEAQFAALPKGSEVWLMDRPRRFSIEPYRLRTWNPVRTLNNGVAGYSLQAWLDDRFGEGHITLHRMSSLEWVEGREKVDVAVDRDDILIVRKTEAGSKDRRIWLKAWRDGWDREIDGDLVRLKPRVNNNACCLIVSDGEGAEWVEIPHAARHQDASE